MKKIFRNNRLIAIALLTMFSTAAAAAVTPDSGFSAKQVELKFTGNVYHQSVFQLKVNGLAGDEFTVTIRDVHGNSVYRENISAGVFSKKFLFDTDELRDETVQFEVYNRKSKQTVLYRVQLATDTRYNASITELK